MRRLFGRFIRNRDGVAALEFGILALPFALLVFAIIETCISFAAQQVMSNAMDEAARRVRTGQPPAMTTATLKAAICKDLSIIAAAGCTGLEVDLRKYDSFRQAAADGYTVVGDKISIKSATGTLSDLKVAPGPSRSINTMRVFYKWPVITDIMRKHMANVGDDKTLLYSTVTWQNEPYDD